MNKCYVRVEIFIDTDGVIIPTKILWDDGRQRDIKKVLHTCVASHNEFEGIRYTIKIGRAVKFLYRDGQRWYVDYSP